MAKANVDSHSTKRVYVSLRLSVGKIEIKFLPRHFRQNQIILPRQFRQNRIILQLSKQNAKFVDIITQLFLDKPNE